MKIGSIARRSAAGIRTVAVIGCLVQLGAGILLAPAAQAASASPTAGDGQLFGIHPVEEGSTTLPGGHFNFAVLPGQRITDGVVVENLSNRTLRFHVYGADLITATGGGLAPAQSTDTMRSVGAWITVSRTMVSVAAHGQVTDTFTLSVPTGVTPGQHLGAVVVSADVGTTSQGNPIEARAALITVVSTPGVSHPSAELSSLRGSTALAGQVSFAITLSNHGNVLLTYSGAISVVDGDGRRIARLPLTPANAYVVPGGHALLAAVWEKAPVSGQYRAQAAVIIVVNGVAVETLRSQSLAVQFSSAPPALIVVGAGIAAALLLVLATWAARRGAHRLRGQRRAVPAGAPRPVG